jgi:peptidoglycan hydrolase-like protein with peptidoglycan-binding domain
MRFHSLFFLFPLLALMTLAVPRFVSADITTGLVGHWTFDNTENDSAGSNHGTLVGGPTYTTGNIGQALTFDGVDDHVTVPDHASLDGMSALTVAMWVQDSTTPGSQRSFLEKVSGAYDINKDANNLLDLRIADGAPNIAAINDIPNTDTLAWMHIAMVYTGTELIGYIDGVEVGRADASGLGAIRNNANVLIMGCDGDVDNTCFPDEFFKGLMDDVRIYNRALAPADITALHAAGNPPIPAIDLTVTESLINPGMSSTLSWRTSDATTCTASGGWSGDKPTTGSQLVSPASTTTYTLTCSGPGGSTTATVTVTVSTVPLGVTYYVSPTGSDSNPGTASSPWKTIVYALSQIKDYDTLILQQGTYRESSNLILKKNNVAIIGQGNVIIDTGVAAFRTPNSGDWVLFDADKKIYRSSLPYTGTFTYAFGTFVHQGERIKLISYPDFARLSDPDEYLGAYAGPGIFWDKTGDQHIYIRLSKTSQMLSPHNSIPDDPNLLSMNITVGGTFFVDTGVHDVHIENITFDPGTVRVRIGAHLVSLKDIAIHQSSQYAIRIFESAYNLTFDNIFIDDHRPPYIAWEDVKQTSLISTMMSYSMQFTPDSHHITVKNSLFRNVHDGIVLTFDANDIEIHNNVFRNVQDDAVQLGSSVYNVNIHHNKMIHVGTGVSRHGSGPNPYPGTKYIHHNTMDCSQKKLWWRKRADGTFPPGADPTGFRALRCIGAHVTDKIGADADPRYYYNNTYLITNNGGGMGYNNYGTQYQNFTTPQLVFNNIFIQTGSEFINAFSLPIEYTGAVLLNGNLYYRMDTTSTRPLFTNVNGQEFYDLDSFRTYTGWETNGVYADPMLDTNYTPQSTVAMGGIDLSNYNLLGVDGVYRGAVKPQISMSPFSQTDRIHNPVRPGGGGAAASVTDAGDDQFSDEEQLQDDADTEDDSSPIAGSGSDAPSASFTFPRNLSLGIRGEDVRALQRYLNAQGFLVAPPGLNSTGSPRAGSPGNETAYFGPATKAALIRFQDAHKEAILTPVGLTQGTGFFGPATRAFVAGSAGTPVQAPRSDAGTSDTSASTAGLTLTRRLALGMRDSGTGGDVSRLQRFLALHAAIYPEGLVTGYFGPLTERAVQRWQIARGIIAADAPETPGYGVVGPKTRASLSSARAEAGNAGTAASPPVSFTLGERIHVTVGTHLNVRAAPGGAIIGSQDNGARGTVIASPVTESGYRWWHVAYEDGLIGWSAAPWVRRAGE